MAITASDVNALRQKTGVGMMDCKKALTEANGDMDKAVEILREKGMATAAKKAGRIAAEGIVDSYIHMGGKVGVLVEVNCETDFVARGDQFKELVHDIALQIAAAKPLYVTKEEVPAGPHQKVLRGFLPARTAVREGFVQDHQPADHRGDRVYRRKDHGSPLRALRDGRGHRKEEGRPRRGSRKTSFQDERLNPKENRRAHKLSVVCPFFKNGAAKAALRGIVRAAGGRKLFGRAFGAQTK